MSYKADKRIEEMGDYEFALNQMRETAQYIDEHGASPDDLAEFLRHWAVVLSSAPLLSDLTNPCINSEKPQYGRPHGSDEERGAA